MVESFLSKESKFQARRRKLKSRGVVLEEPKAMSIKATSVISDARLERLRKYLENEVTTTMIHRRMSTSLILGMGRKNICRN